jgi:tripartite-type tricarboxylate transporter receptor subunit TctC
VQLVGKHINATVNNPIEAILSLEIGHAEAALRGDGKRLQYSDQITATQSWADIKTCKEEG